MLAPVTHILPITTVRRKRTLPIPGRVIVRRGQKVSATEVVAEAKLAPEHLLLDFGRGLGLNRDLADDQLQVKAGALVEQGDVLAGPVGLAKRVMRAPRNGRVVLARDGLVLLELDSPRYELKAGLPGTVIELLGDRGVVIEATGGLVQGVWGNGHIDSGLMVSLAATPDDLLTAGKLEVGLRGSIVLAGHCEDASALEAAAGLPLRGLVLASLSSTLVPLAESQPFPIMILEGVGQLPINSAVFKILGTGERREAALNAEPWDRFKGSRPELVIPLPAAGELPLPRDAEIFTPGQRVRVLRTPHRGEIGTLVDVRPGFAVLPSGVRAPSGEVRLESGVSAVLPLANLEVLA